MLKLVAMMTSVVISLGLAAVFPAQGPGRDDPEPPRAKEKGKAKGKEEARKKAEAGPRGDLTKAYDLLRRLRAADGAAGRSEERIRDWTDRAARYYRDGLKALSQGDDFLAHEYGAIAHDLARAADHAQSAAILDRRDPELPPPTTEFGPQENTERARRDLNRAYDRLGEVKGGETTREAAVYVKAARDLYTAARRDLEAGRDERGGELARAAEAMTHVIDHLGHVADGPPDRPGRGLLKAAPRREPPAPPDGPEPKEKRGRRRDAELPPPLPPE